MQKFRKEISLAFVNPELAKEWDFERNQPLTPESVFAKSGKKVWWKCKKCGNKWRASPHDIIDKNVICHRCNSLVVKNPKLVKEWNTVKNGKLTPYDVSYCSGKKVWWKCKKGHEWVSTVAHRNNGRGCPYCFNKKVCIDNCLCTLMPYLAKEWDYDGNKKTGLTPNNVSIGSSYKISWICPINKNHKYKALIKERSRGLGCPYCSNHRVDENNCLITLYPKLAEEWNNIKNKNLSPSDVTWGSSRKVWWKCKKGHEWRASVKTRSNGSGCPYCANLKVCNDNCLMTLNPKLAKEWDYNENGGLTPKDVTVCSGKKVWWICSNCKGRWESQVSSRHNGSGCPYCYKVKLKDGTVWDSLVEAYYYLNLVGGRVKFDHHVKIGLGKCSCDFYFKDKNKYVEVTGYSNKSRQWDKYYKNILRKKSYIMGDLKADFEFVQINLTPDQYRYVRLNEI